MAVCLLLSLVFLVGRMMLAALVSGLVAAGTAVVALVVGMFKSQPESFASPAGPLGSGPHATHKCAPNPDRVAALGQMAQQLRDAAKDEHWTLDWASFNAHGEQAQAALAAGDFAHAVREYAEAIVFMMDQIRGQGVRKDHRDSSVLDT
jgi:hypothetical protein